MIEKRNPYLMKLLGKEVTIYAENKMYFNGKMLGVEHPFILIDTNDRGKILINIKQINSINVGTSRREEESYAGEL